MKCQNRMFMQFGHNFTCRSMLCTNLGESVSCSVILWPRLSYDYMQCGKIVTIVLESFLQCFMLCSLFLQLFLISCIRAMSSFHNLYAPWISIRHHWCQSGSVIMTQVIAVVLLLSFPLSSYFTEQTLCFWVLNALQKPMGSLLAISHNSAMPFSPCPSQHESIAQLSAFLDLIVTVYRDRADRAGSASAWKCMPV